MIRDSHIAATQEMWQLASYYQDIINQKRKAEGKKRVSLDYVLSAIVCSFLVENSDRILSEHLALEEDKMRKKVSRDAKSSR